MSNYKNKSGYYGNKNGDISGSTEDNGGNDNVFIGRNAVLELLKSGREIDKLYVQKGEREGSITLIVARAAESRIPVVEVDKHRLDKMSAGGVHQGVAAIASETAYVSVEDILAIAAERGEKPFIVICDSINDPHNLGAIIRTAECAGVHGVIIPKRRSCKSFCRRSFPYGGSKSIQSQFCDENSQG